MARIRQFREGADALAACDHLVYRAATHVD
jgi:hypothetical protein